MIGAERRVVSEFIEINTVRARMIEHSVENDAHPPLFRLFDEFRKLLFRAEKRVNLHIIGGIVAVIGMTFEYRRKIYGGHAQRSYIIETGYYPFYITAVEVVGAVNAIGIAYGQRFVPGFEYAALLVEHGILVLALVETVDEDLVDKSALAKVGRLVARTENGELPGRLIFVGIAHLASPLRV